MNTQPDPDTPDIPPEELEMAVEESLGKPPRRTPDEGVEIARQRVRYLEEQLRGQVPEELLARLHKDLADAKRLLAEYELQQGGMN